MTFQTVQYFPPYQQYVYFVVIDSSPSRSRLLICIQIYA